MSVTEVSARLRAARERAGLTIQDISASTKIRAGSLEALERGNFAALPGEFYTRAFLRAYASQVGLSPDAVLQEYESEHAGAHLPGRESAAVPHSQHSRASNETGTSRQAWSYLARVVMHPGVAIGLVVILLVTAVIRSRPAATPAPETAAVGTTGSSASVPAPTAAAAPRPGVAQTLTMEIQAESPIWVTGAADGKRVLYRLLAPGDRVTLQARDHFAFRIGNAAAFTYSINGVAGKPLGGPGEVRDVEITRENYRSFARESR